MTSARRAVTSRQTVVRPGDSLFDQARLLAQPFLPDAAVVLDLPRFRPRFVSDLLGLETRLGEDPRGLSLSLDARLLHEHIRLRAGLATDVVTLLARHGEYVLRSLLGCRENRIHARADAAVLSPGAFSAGRRFFGVHRAPE
jgi:hypothetical protein